MFVQPVFTGGYSKGRKLFNELPKGEQFAKIVVERARQNFNRTTVLYRLDPPASTNQDLQDYVRLKVSLQDIIKKFQRNCVKKWNTRV